MGHRAHRIGRAKELVAYLQEGNRWDMVFNICEGIHGRSREAQVPSILELYRIPYTFSDPLTLSLTLDKAMAKRVVAFEGVPTSPFVCIEDLTDITAIRLEYPLFVKPNQEGTGKGIDDGSVCYTEEQLYIKAKSIIETYSQPALVEELLPGREFTVGIIGSGRDAQVMGTLEIKVIGSSNGVYSFENKEFYETRVQYEPLEKGRLKEEIEALALRAYKVLGIRDLGRLDFRLDKDGRPMFLEANPLPGLHPTHSDLPMIARANGLTYEGLISQVVESALKRLRGGSGRISSETL
jgi:D-alanine-D-alanine ligase